jgi:uncharacterized membrane protein
MKLNKIFWVLLIIFAIAIGFYPFTYLIIDMKSNGLLASKSQELLSSSIYNIGFYVHILLGGVALLIGWSQFSKKWRKKNIKLHRTVGNIYIIVVLLSGIAGLYIAFYATGGIGTKLGFGFLAIFWLITTIMAFISIKNKEIIKHQKWMIRSYALCFAAVTLRLWMPILPAIFNLEFSESYAIISWLCWIPNLVVAEILISKIKS